MLERFLGSIMITTSPPYTENTRADTYTYGATGALLVQGQVKAKKRVLYFITVFVVNGFFSKYL